MSSRCYTCCEVTWVAEEGSRTPCWSCGSVENVRPVTTADPWAAMAQALAAQAAEVEREEAGR